MDFLKNQKSNSTSSIRSNSSKKSRTATNGGASFNLVEYCTSNSTSNMSPLLVTTNVAPNVNTIRTETTRVSYCESSPTKSLINVDVFNDLLLSSSDGSCKSRKSINASISKNSCSRSGSSKRSLSPPTTSAAAYLLMNSSSSHQKKSVKRKRKISYLDDKEPEFGSEPPSAKRQQRLPSLYTSDNASEVSSAFLSPVDEIAHDIDLHSSSECISSVSSVYNDVVRTGTAHDIPESPTSLVVQHDIDDIDVIDSPTLQQSDVEIDEEGEGEQAEEEILSEDIVNSDSENDDDTNSSTDNSSQDEIDDDDNIVDEEEDHEDDVKESVKIDTCSTTPPSICSHDSHIMTRGGDSNANCDCIKLHCTEEDILTNDSDSDSDSDSVNDRDRDRVHVRDHFEQPKVKSFEDFLNAQYDMLMTPAEDTDEKIRQCPLPALSWANANDVWQLMCNKDEKTAILRNAEMLDQHPGLHPRMRAILLDWIIEVCEVYKLHRETFYLALDFLDRYLTAQKKVQKTHLQLIGVTCLFLAAKIEEIYPPKICEFAYVTDGACKESDILHTELLLLQALDWNISPVTPIGWLGVYMQLNVNNRTPASLKRLATDVKKEATDAGFIYPQFSGFEFSKTAQLLDLCTLDVGFSNFPYSVIAAATISHTVDKATAIQVSGLDWQTIQPCVDWMKPFFQVICEDQTPLHMIEQNEPITTKCGLGHVCPNIVTDDSHILQLHTISMDMFDRVCKLQSLITPLKIIQELETNECLLTPPDSSRKFLDGDGETNPNHQVQSVVDVTNTTSKTELKQQKKKSTTMKAHTHAQTANKHHYQP